MWWSDGKLRSLIQVKVVMAERYVEVSRGPAVVAFYKRAPKIRRGRRQPGVLFEWEEVKIVITLIHKNFRFCQVAETNQANMFFFDPVLLVKSWSNHGQIMVKSSQNQVVCNSIFLETSSDQNCGCLGPEMVLKRKISGHVSRTATEAGLKIFPFPTLPKWLKTIGNVIYGQKMWRYPKMRLKNLWCVFFWLVVLGVDEEVSKMIPVLRHTSWMASSEELRKEFDAGALHLLPSYSGCQLTDYDTCRHRERQIQLYTMYIPRRKGASMKHLILLVKWRSLEDGPWKMIETI